MLPSQSGEIVDALTRRSIHVQNRRGKWPVLEQAQRLGDLHRVAAETLGKLLAKGGHRLLQGKEVGTEGL